MSVSENTVVRRSESPVETTVGTEIVLMSLESGQCYGLGETGSDVWRALATPASVAELAAVLRTSYDAPGGEIERDVAELVEKMAAMGLVMVSDPA